MSNRKLNIPKVGMTKLEGTMKNGSVPRIAPGRHGRQSPKSTELFPPCNYNPLVKRSCQCCD